MVMFWPQDGDPVSIGAAATFVGILRQVLARSPPSSATSPSIQPTIHSVSNSLSLLFVSFPRLSKCVYARPTTTASLLAVSRSFGAGEAMLKAPAYGPARAEAETNRLARKCSNP